MKLYYIGLFQTSPSTAPSELASTTSLSTFPYLERPKISTYLTSLATTVATHTPPHTRYTIKDGGYAFQCYAIDDWAGVVICSRDYVSNRAHMILGEAMDQRGREAQHIDLAAIMARYQKLTAAARSWERVREGEVGEVRELVWHSMESLLHREVESLLEKSERLGVCSKLFYIQAKEGQYYCAVM